MYPKRLLSAVFAGTVNMVAAMGVSGFALQNWTAPAWIFFGVWSLLIVLIVYVLHGDQRFYRVIYEDGQPSELMHKKDARGYANIFGGHIELAK